MTKFGGYFHLDEFLRSEVAARMGIDMTPPPEVRSALRALVMEVLDPLRSHLNRPIVVQSGYRPPQLNQKIGGSRNSQHVLGQAADINVPGLSPKSLAGLIVDLGLPYDQVINEFGSWVHVSYGPRHRREVLTATRHPSGRIEYTRGLG